MTTNITSPHTVAPIRLAVSVPLKAALARGSARAGDAAIELTTETLAALDGVTLGRFAAWSVPTATGVKLPNVGYGPLHSVPVTIEDGDSSPAGVARAITNHVAALADIAGTLEGRFTIRPELAVETPRVDIGTTYVTACYAASSPTVTADYLRLGALTAGGDSPVLAGVRAWHATRRAEVIATIEAHLATIDPASPEGGALSVGYDARISHTILAWCKTAETAKNARETEARARREAAEEAAVAKREAREALCHASVRAFALSAPELAPGAEDGHDMGPGVANLLSTRIAAALDGVPGVTGTRVIAQGGPGWDETDHADARKNPTAEAVKARREGAKLVELIGMSFPEGVTADVSPVGRVVDVECADRNGGVVRRTGFTVLLIGESGCIPQRLVVAWVE